MDIIFKQINDQEIKIIDKETNKEIGHIFSPSGSNEDEKNAIQVCGFDYAFDLWGCGIYKKKGTNHCKKDIQLFYMNDSEKVKQSDYGFLDKCTKCFSDPCKCKELRIYGHQEIPHEIIMKEVEK